MCVCVAMALSEYMTPAEFLLVAVLRRGLIVMGVA